MPEKIPEKIMAWAVEAIRKNSGYNLVLDFLEANFQDFSHENIIVVSIGKAAVSMAQGAKEFLGKRIKRGIVISNKEGEVEGFEFYLGSHPYPDSKSLKAGKALLSLAEETGPQDLVLFLISGGASSLAVLPHPPFTFEDLFFIYRKLILSGASIGEINTVRRHISLIKGGRLARAFAPSRVITLAISDVMGDKPQDIGSGPTVPDPTTLEGASEIMKKYGLSSFLDKLSSVPETPKPTDPVFRNNRFVVLANTLRILKDIEKMAKKEGFETIILTSEDRGEASQVSGVYSGILFEILRSGNPWEPPLVLLSGGELTVTVRGDGKGGRNTEFLLALIRDCREIKGQFCALSMGTDGIDGPTDAAGAAFCSDIYEKMGDLKPEEYLANNDSYTFFNKLGLLIKTGPTDTNLRDIRIFWIGKRKGH